MPARPASDRQPGQDLPEEADALFGLPLDAFVAERGALVRRLKKDGRREEAARVAALRKPSVAAWAVNQVVRSQPSAARAAFAAGDALIDAQNGLLAGKVDAADFRAVRGHFEEALGALDTAARGLLDERGRGLGEPTLDRAASALRTAVLDPTQRADAVAGTLAREPTAMGFPSSDLAPQGDGPAAGNAPAEPRRSRTERDARRPAEIKAAKTAEPKAAAKEKAAKPKAAVRAKAAERRSAAQREAEQRRRATEERLHAAEERLREAQAAVDVAEANRDDAQREANEARAVHERTDPVS